MPEFAFVTCFIISLPLYEYSGYAFLFWFAVGAFIYRSWRKAIDDALLERWFPGKFY